MYFGPIGDESQDLMNYITAISPEFALPENKNPADHMLDVCKKGAGGGGSLIVGVGVPRGKRNQK